MAATLRGRGVIAGVGAGAALVTRTPINFTAALAKAANAIPWRRSELRDRHHELFGAKIAGRVLVFPTCVGSTYTGVTLMELLTRGAAPAALVVQEADPLLVSGVLLARSFFARSLPVVEYPGAELFARVATGDRVVVDGGSGELRIAGS